MKEKRKDLTPPYAGFLVRLTRPFPENFFGNERLRNITPFRVESLKSSLVGKKTVRGTPRSGATVNRYLALLSKIFSLAHDNRMMDKNPCSRARRLEEGGKRERYLTGDEETRLTEVLTGDLDYLRAPITISLNTGVRRSELLSLKASEINLGQMIVFSRVNGRDIAIPPGCLLVAKSKNKESWIIPLNQEVRQALMAVLGEVPGGETIFTVARNGVSASTIKLGFELACDRAQITYGLNAGWRSNLAWTAAHICDAIACGRSTRLRHKGADGP